MFSDAPEPSPTLKRPRGRPRGSKAVVVRPGADGRALGVHHVAFLRSTLLGLDLRAAFERYLAFGETTTDLRHIEARRRELLVQIVDSGRRLTLARPDDAALERDVDLLKIDAAPAKAVTLPSLDEWVEAEGMDPDMWSEAELLAEYQAAFGLDNVEAIEAAEGAADLVKERVKALNRLSALLTVAPKADDKVDAWFARPRRAAAAQRRCGDTGEPLPAGERVRLPVVRQSEGIRGAAGGTRRGVAAGAV